MRETRMSKQSVPDRFYNGGDFNDIYLRQQQELRSNHSEKDKSVSPLDDSFQRWLDSLPPLPVHAPECKCEICVGLKVCPECNIRSMYLDRQRRAWRCIKCQRHYAIVDPTKNSEGSAKGE